MAIKIINLEDAGDEVEDVHQEISVMSQMHCPQLTKYYASYVVESDLWYIIFKLCCNIMNFFILI